MSSFSWLDFAEHDRRRALEVIQLFRERDTVDELGLGTIRDAFAELLLPGTSVIHTRARYFFFIPWIYLGLERKKTPSEKIAGEARRREIALIDALLASPDTQGVIGARARATLKILPSNIYWQALHQLGFRFYPGTRDQYHRSLDRFYLSGARAIRTDDGDRVDYHRIHNWNPNIPKAPEDFPAKADLSLRPEEAEFLRERIIQSAPKSLYRFLVEDRSLTAEPKSAWEYATTKELPAILREQIAHAQNFSQAMNGAPLMYNLMLAELSNRDDLVETYIGRFTEWREAYQSRNEDFIRWDHRRFWETVMGTGARVTPSTRAFVDQWLNLTQRSDANTLRASSEVRALIKTREEQLKRGQARLISQRARELWNGDSGTQPLTYRWAIASGIAREIHQGLAAEVANA